MRRLSFVMLIIFVMPLFLGGCKDSGLNFSNLNTYSMNLDYNDAEKSLSGEMAVDYINHSDNVLKEVKFHLYPNAFREGAKNKPVSFSSQQRAYPNGLSYGKIEILECHSNQNEMLYQVAGEDENILNVVLKEDLYPNASIRININFKSYLPNCNHRYGFGDNTINFGNFYPIACVSRDDGSFMTNPYHSNGDPFFSDIANYDVTINYPKNLILASTGETLHLENKGDKKVSKMKILGVRDFAFMMSEKFQVLQTNVGRTKVLYYYYDDENAEKSLETSALAIKTFNETFGEYPFSTFSVVKTNFVHGGMEYPTLIMVSDTLSSYEEYTNVIIHEAAHQWWYSLVGNNEYSDAWLDEGLTEYSTALFYQKNPNYGIELESIMQNAISGYQAFIEIYSGVFGNVDTSMDRALNEYKTEPEYVYVAYTKGMLLFDTLRNLIGDKKFFEAMQMYFHLYKYKNATPYHLIATFEKAAGRNLETFFDSWIDGRVIIM